jgi:hypothetical protein
MTVPGDPAIRLVDREHTRDDDRSRPEQPGDRGRHRAGDEEDDHRREDDERPLRAPPEEDRLPAQTRPLAGRR